MPKAKRLKMDWERIINQVLWEIYRDNLSERTKEGIAKAKKRKANENNTN